MMSRFKIIDNTIGIIYEFNNRHEFTKRWHEYVDNGYSVRWKRYPYTIDVYESKN